MKKIAILASGSGTNAENIHQFFSKGSRIAVDLVIYDRKNAGVAPRMEAYGVETLYIPKSVWTDEPHKIVELLQNRGIDLVVLAGFLRIIPSQLTDAFQGRMINIHPSLLPAYGGPGMFGHKVHQAVIDAGESKSGVTVHYVSDVVDGGEILMQQVVEITPEDTPETLEAKIHTVEYSLFPRAIVAALEKLPKAGAAVPPPNPDKEWAQALGMNFDASKLPPIPGKDPEIQNNANPPEVPASVSADPTPSPGYNPYEPARDRSKTSAVNTQFVSTPDQYGFPPSGNVEEAKRLASAHQYPTQSDGPQMPKSYLIWAIVMTLLCCMPAGVVAIIFSTQVSSKYFAGDIAGAQKASQRAEIWIITSFVLGVLANTLTWPLMLLF